MNQINMDKNNYKEIIIIGKEIIKRFKLKVHN